MQQDAVVSRPTGCHYKLYKIFNMHGFTKQVIQAGLLQFSSKLGEQTPWKLKLLAASCCMSYADRDRKLHDNIFNIMVPYIISSFVEDEDEVLLCWHMPHEDCLDLIIVIVHLQNSSHVEFLPLFPAQ